MPLWRGKSTQGDSRWVLVDILRGGNMRSDFCIIEHEFPRRDIKIYPLSDLHVGAQEFNENAWKALKKQILSGPDNYLIIAGDL